jgi:hypothetical protein
MLLVSPPFTAIVTVVVELLKYSRLRRAAVLPGFVQRTENVTDVVFAFGDWPGGFVATPVAVAVACATGSVEPPPPPPHATTPSAVAEPSVKKSARKNPNRH